MLNYKEVEDRLKALGHDDLVVAAVVSAMVSMDKYGLSEDQKYMVFSLLSSTGFEALESLPDAVAKGQWVDFDYGNVSIGDYVRIKKDAYTSESGVKHNGKVGRLAYMHGGKCMVSYIGIDVGDQMRHPMTNLESLKRV